MVRASRLSLALFFTFLSGLFTATVAFATDDDNVLKNLHKVTTIASTLPANQDVNPYGVARVPRTIGNLVAGHLLRSNFNNSSAAQGTVTPIVDVASGGPVTLFPQIVAPALPGSCPGGVGLTPALAVLRSGWVIVGSLPATDGTSATAQAGCLIVLDNSGKP